MDHQRLQQFITSPAWDYAGVRRNVARWFASGFPVEALIVDDTGFPKDGDASPCVARQLALDMIEEMTGSGGWGVPDLATGAGDARPVVAVGIGYGDNALFREQLTARGWRYAVAVEGGTTAHDGTIAHDGGAVPQARPRGGPACPRPPATLRTLAHAAQVRPVTWRQGARTSTGNPDAAMTSSFLAIRVRPAGRRITRAADGSLSACWPDGLPKLTSRPVAGWLRFRRTPPSKSWSAWPRDAWVFHHPRLEVDGGAQFGERHRRVLALEDVAADARAVLLPSSRVRSDRGPADAAGPDRGFLSAGPR